MFIKRKARAAATALIVAGVSAAAALSASAATRPSARHQDVSVHQANCRPRSRSMGRLRKLGPRYRTTAARRLHRLGPPESVEGLGKRLSRLIADFLHTITGPIVLVGHSYGGAVTTNAAYGDSQVKALVYVDAFIPAQGDTLVSLTGAGSCFAVNDLNSVFTFVPFPGAPPTVADAYVKQSVFPSCFANEPPRR